jgi:transposase
MTTTLSQISALRPGTSVIGTRPVTSDPPSPQSLSQAVQQTVRWVDDSALRRVAPREAGPAFEPRTLLAILTYCYAREIYGSADIEDRMRRDEPFRRLCKNEFPGARVFRRFRRENREVLQNCLYEVLRWLMSGSGAPTQGTTAITDEDIALAASRRMSAAMFVDSMEQFD